MLSHSYLNTVEHSDDLKSSLQFDFMQLSFCEEQYNTGEWHAMNLNSYIQITLIPFFTYFIYNLLEVGCLDNSY